MKIEYGQERTSAIWALKNICRKCLHLPITGVILPSLTLVNPKSRSKAFIYQAGATFQFRSDMCYILSCGSWFDFFGAFYYIPHLRFGNEFDIGMKAKMDM